jgi:hypothetical protein
MISAAVANPDLANPRCGPSPSGSTRTAPAFSKQRTCGWIRARQVRPASFTGAAAKEEDPGSAFGPESIPSATGLVSVVYWVPGPFPGPTPVQPDERRSPLQCHAEPRGRLDAGALHHDVTPNLTSLPVRLASPGAGLSSNLPLIPPMSTVSRAATLPKEIIRLHFATARGQFFSAARPTPASRLTPQRTGPSPSTCATGSR